MSRLSHRQRARLRLVIAYLIFTISLRRCMSQHSTMPFALPLTTSRYYCRQRTPSCTPGRLVAMRGYFTPQLYSRIQHSRATRAMPPRGIIDRARPAHTPSLQRPKSPPQPAAANCSLILSNTSPMNIRFSQNARHGHEQRLYPARRPAHGRHFNGTPPLPRPITHLFRPCAQFITRTFH